MKAAGFGQACTSAGFCKRLQQKILRRRSLDPRSNDLDTMTSAHAWQAPLEGRIKIGDKDKNGFRCGPNCSQPCRNQHPGALPRGKNSRQNCCTFICQNCGKFTCHRHGGSNVLVPSLKSLTAQIQHLLCPGRDFPRQCSEHSVRYI